MRLDQRAVRQQHGTLSVRETAELLGVARRTIHRWQVDGRMPERVPNGRRLQYRLSDILAMADRSSGQQTSQGTTKRR